MFVVNEEGACAEDRERAAAAETESGKGCAAAL
jgi:hypothetical protein